jgi:hypothetical protein
VQAQTLRGTILGTITDQSGAVIPGVQVVITETGTNFTRTASANDSGFYAFANLDPGAYRVEAEHPGFRRIIRAGIELRPNVTVRVDLELQPGVVSETVDVTASAPLLQTDRADTGGQIEVRQLQTLPLTGNRNYQGLLLLVPGVGKPFKPHSEFYNSQDHLSTRVNGQGRQANNFQVEGIDNNVDNGNLSALVPPIEAIAAVDMTTSNYDPEFGRASGAVANVTMRSGTNEFHGSLFHYHRNENAQARNYFAKTKAPIVYNQFGGTLGGPIRRDRTFFFTDYQGSRDHLGTTSLATIPTLPFRQGDLSAAPTIIYDPLTGDAQGRNRTPFENKQIPLSRISPISRRLLDLIPAPLSSDLQTNYQVNRTRVKTLDQADTKIDHVFTENDRIFFRYSYQKAQVTDIGMYELYGGPRNNGFAGTGPARSQSGGLNYSRIMNPTLVTEVRFGFVRNRNDALTTDTGSTISRELGIPGVNLDQWSSGLTEIRVNGYTNPVLGYDPSMPWERAITSFGLVNNWTKTHRNHVIKFGTDIRRERNDIIQTAAPRGRWTFTEGPAALNGDARTGFGNSFAAFLLDQPNAIERGLRVGFPARREIMYNFYFQDKWQVSQKLTLDLGLRWEFWPSAKPRFPGGFSNYNPFNNTLELAGLGDIPLNLGITNRKRSFAPRFGLAYRFDDKTVLRGGYGISYFQRGLGLSAGFNFPVRQNQQLNAANAFSAAGSLAAGIPTPQPAIEPPDGIIRNPQEGSYTHTPYDLFHGYVQSWNVALQRALPGNFAFEAAFVGSHSVNNPTGTNLNAGRVLGAGAAGQPLNTLFGRRANTSTTIGTHAYYDALQAKFDRRFSNGFQLTTAYTYSKTIDFCTDRCDVAVHIPEWFFLNRGRSNHDQTHSFVQSYIYELPFGSGKRWANSGPVRWIAGDWQVNGVMTRMTGRPLNITFSNTSLNAPGNGNRPNLIGTGEPEKLGLVGPGQKWFDISRFAAPAANTFGNVGRNIMTGPGIFNLDFSVFRKFRVTERYGLELRAEAFNLTNTPQFDQPNTTFGSAGFGEITTAQGDQATPVNPNRQMQFSLRFTF